MLIRIFSILVLALFVPCFPKDKLPVSAPEPSNVGFSSFSDEFISEFDDIKDSGEVFESYNRSMTIFNDNLYVYFLHPVAVGYSYILPSFARTGVSNFFKNIGFVSRFINNMLQFKISNSVEELGRFTINSTVGILGLFDVATMMGIGYYDEDFGQTLGHYGTGSGFYIVLPVAGPSNARDAFGSIVDIGFDFVALGKTSGNYEIYLERVVAAVSLKSCELINENSLNLDVYENLKKDSIDLHSFLKSIYEQSREAQIKE